MFVQRKVKHLSVGDTIVQPPTGGSIMYSKVTGLKSESRHSRDFDTDVVLAWQVSVKTASRDGNDGYFNREGEDGCFRLLPNDVVMVSCP